MNRWTLALGLLACSIASSVPAAAQPGPETPAPEAPKPLAEVLTGMPKAEYEAGKVLFADGDFANAILKFQKAHELSHEPRLLWNIAVCEKNLRRYSKMLRSIRRYLDEAGPKLTAEERQRAVEIVETVKAFVSELVLAAEPAPDDVLVDGESVLADAKGGGKVLVDVGKRTITVRKSGFKDAVRTIEVTGGGVTKLAVVLDRDLHRGKLHVKAGPNDLISLDGKAVGLGTWDGSLPSGGHTLRVTATGMRSQQQDVSVRDGEERSVGVQLERQQGDPTSRVVWIVGGAVLAVAAGVTAAVLYAPLTVEPVRGSIDPGNVQLSFGRRGR